MSMNTKHMNKYTKKRKLVRNNSYTKMFLTSLMEHNASFIIKSNISEILIHFKITVVCFFM